MSLARIEMRNVTLGTPGPLHVSYRVPPSGTVMLRLETDAAKTAGEKIFELLGRADRNGIPIRDPRIQGAVKGAA